ncbi:MAG: 16S rRNA (cytidine(1402)-2'-O)-methyltransferase [Verrucomicrobiota bacterium]
MLYVVPTPIGNLGDITLRALEVLKDVQVIACEDTRHTRKLLTHFEIEGKELVALHDHNEERQAEVLLERIRNGEDVALVSDAGMPLVSDPGFRVVRGAREHGLEVTVLPGASAPVTALVASGLPPYPHRFGGFLPVKKGRRRNELEAALGRDETALWFESPHRIGSTLEILAELKPEQLVVVARELTKKFETVYRGTAAELAKEFEKKPARGEMVLLVHGEVRKEQDG